MVSIIETPAVLAALATEGVVVLPDLVDEASLRAMQRAFQAMLVHQRWNGTWGYFNDDNRRHIVSDVLTLDRAFVDVALHPQLIAVLRGYVGPEVAITEAKGWRSLACLEDYHTWHVDAWHRHDLDPAPKQLKLAVYLSDTTSGGFAYVPGSQGSGPTGHWKSDDPAVQSGRVHHGPAGTAILFDPSGIHRQSYPILEDRDAIFLVYNDPDVPVQPEDYEAYRYHPPLVSPAYLGHLDNAQLEVLGVGRAGNVQPGFVPPPRHPRLERAMTVAFNGFIGAEKVWFKARDRLARLRGA